MPGLNRVSLIGSVGSAPEMRYTPTGRAVTSFSLGVDDTWETSESQAADSTTWFNVVAWDDLAEESHRVFDAGELAFVEGRLQVRAWESEDGTQHYLAEVVASRVIALEGNGSHQTGLAPASQGPSD